MRKPRRSFSTEFKYDAAALVLDQGYSVTEACRSLDVGETALGRWVDQLRAEREGITLVSKAMTPEQKRIQALGMHIRGLETERRVLRKVTALLMSDDWSRTS